MLVNNRSNLFGASGLRCVDGGHQFVALRPPPRCAHLAAHTRLAGATLTEDVEEEAMRAFMMVLG
jgi:hypothetical protein